MNEKKKQGREAPASSMTAEETVACLAELRRPPAPVPVSEVVLLLDRSRDVVRALLVSFGLPGFDAPPAIKEDRFASRGRARRKLVALTWSCLDLARGVLTLDRNKTREQQRTWSCRRRGDRLLPRRRCDGPDLVDESALI